MQTFKEFCAESDREELDRVYMALGIPGTESPTDAIVAMQTAHRQLQATIDRLGNENAKLRAALNSVADHPDVPLWIRGIIENILNEQLAPPLIHVGSDGNPHSGSRQDCNLCQR